MFALTRALVFTKEAYRTLRAKVTPRRRPAIDDSEALAAATAQQAMMVGASAVSPMVSDASSLTPADALTPWDMIDEEDSPAGVTFTIFQQRRRTTRQVAA
jgi:hypothetical protein